MSNYTAAGVCPGAKEPAIVENSGTRQKLEQVRLQMACAEDLFNCATDESMLEACIYQMKSLQVYYSFLVRQLRQEEQEKAALPCQGEEGAPGLLAAVKERMMEVMG